MAIITRGGVRTDLGETISEFRQRLTKARIKRRGLSKSEKRRKARAEKEAFRIAKAFSVEELAKAGEVGAELSIIKRRTGERVFVKRGGGRFTLTPPKGTKLITKADGTQVFQRIIQTAQGTVIEETKATPSFLGRAGKITQARITTTQRFKPKTQKIDFSVIDEFTGIDRTGSPTEKIRVLKSKVTKKGIPVATGKPFDKLIRKIKKEGEQELKDFTSIPSVQQRIESIGKSAKTVDEVTKFLVKGLGIPKGFQQVKKFVNFVGKQVSKAELINLQVLGFSEAEAKRLVEKQRQLRKDFGSGLVLDIAEDIIDEPTKNAVLFFASAGFSKGVKTINKSLKVLATTGYTKTATAIKGAGVLGIGALSVAYASDVATKMAQDLEATGKIRDSLKDTAREMLIFSLGARFGGKLTRAEKVKLARFNRLKSQLSPKDLAKLRRIGKKAKDDFFLVERLEGLRELRIKRVKGRAGKKEVLRVTETVTKIVKAKKKPKIKRKITLKGEGTKVVEFTDKFGKVTSKGKIKIEAVLKDGKLIITEKNIVTGKTGKQVELKFDRFDANAFKRVEVTTKGKLKTKKVIKVGKGITRGTKFKAAKKGLKLKKEGDVLGFFEISGKGRKIVVKKTLPKTSKFRTKVRNKKGVNTFKDVVLHEIGHDADLVRINRPLFDKLITSKKKVFSIPKQKTKIINLQKKLIRKGVISSDFKGNVNVVELRAELFRAYLQNPKLLRKNAPTVFNAIEKELLSKGIQTNIFNIEVRGKPKTFTRKAPKREVVPVVDKKTTVLRNVKVDGKLVDVEVFALKPVKPKAKPKKVRVPKITKRKLDLFILDDKGKIFFSAEKQRTDIFKGLKKPRVSKPKKIVTTGEQVGEQVTVKKVKTKKVVKQVKAPIISVVSAVTPEETVVLFPFTTQQRGQLTPILKPFRPITPREKPIVVSRTDIRLEVKKTPITDVLPVTITKPKTKPKIKITQIQIPKQQQEILPALTTIQKPKLTVEEKLRFPARRLLKVEKPPIVPIKIPFIKFKAKAKKKKVKLKATKTKLAFTTTIKRPVGVSGARFRKLKKKEELILFTGGELR